MIETLHMIIEVLATAKVEMGVFLLAACIHFVLFSNYAPAARASLLGEKSSPKLAAAGATGGATRRASASSTGNSMAQALKDGGRDGESQHRAARRVFSPSSVDTLLGVLTVGVKQLMGYITFVTSLLRAAVRWQTSNQLEESPPNRRMLVLR